MNPSEYYQYEYSNSGSLPNVNSQLNFRITGGVWHLDNGRWWYEYAGGSYPANKWEFIDGSWFFFDSAGWMVTGWIKQGSLWYFCEANGVMVTGWKRVDGIDYMFNSSGGLAITRSDFSIAYGFNYSNLSTVSDAQYMNNALLRHNYTSNIFTSASKSHATATEVSSIARMNRGVFIFTGHGNFNSLSFYNGSNSLMQDFDIPEMNNCKVALLFACEAGSGNLLNKFVSKGAKAAYGYNQVVYASSDSIVSRRLVDKLCAGYTLEAAAADATNSVPAGDATRDYRIIGNGRTVINLTTPKQSTILQIPEQIKRQYTLYNSTASGSKTYIKYLNGIVTTDSYIEDIEGNVLAWKNDFPNITNEPIPSPTESIPSATIPRPIINDENHSNVSSKFYDSYVIIDQQIKLVRIFTTEYNENQVDIQCLDLMNGEEISYNDILFQSSNYK